MKFKAAFWYPIAVAGSVINLVAIGQAAGASEPLHASAHAALALAFAFWARRVRRGTGGGDMSSMKQQLDQQAAALEEAQAVLSSQSTELAELQERVDFAERLLAQTRDRPPLSRHDERS